jgi:hypothetical protein
MSRSVIGAKKLAAGVVGSVMLMAGEPALAWDGVVSGTIFAIDVTQGNNFGLPVHVNGVTTACSGGASWSYLNETDSNYKTYVAALMMAKAQGSAVTIYSNLENGYCRIGYITIT